MGSSDDLPGSLPLHFSWIGTLCGALLLLLGEVLPVRMTFVRPDTLFVALLEVELAFVLFVWPLFVLRRGGLSKGPEGRRLLLILGEELLLLVSSLPLALIASNVSNVGAGRIAGAMALLAALAAFPACLFHAAARRGVIAGPGYLLGAFGVSALLPFLRFLDGPRWEWASALSPFWAAGTGDVLWPAGVYGGLAAVIAGLSAYSRKAVDAPSPSQ